jgi:dynein heavy chain 1
VTDYSKRLNVIATGLFETCYRRVARGMLHHDRIVFALLLSRIYLKGLKQDNSIEEEFQHLLRGNQVSMLQNNDVYYKHNYDHN